MKSIRSLWFVFFALFAFVLAACGSGGSPAPGTNSQPPLVSAAAATGVTVDAATLNGNVNPNGNATTVWFEWGTSSTLASYTATASQSIGSGAASLAITANLSGLIQNTTYYYRVCANSSADQPKSSIVSFTTGTPAAAPTVQTFAPSGVTTSAATLNGGVNPNGLVTTAWFEWGTSATLASYTATANQSIGSGVASVSITANLIGLASSTTYYYRACGSSSAGTIRGSITLLVTLTPAVPPTVTTLGATNLTTTTATLNATVNPNSLATLAFFEWGTSATLATFTTTTAQSIGSGSAAVAVSENLIGLVSNTTYYYRVGATNAAGGNIGTIASFTTHILTGLAPSITGLSVGTPTGDNVSVTLTVDPKDPTAVTDAWLEISQDNNVWTPTAHQSVSPGAPTTLPFNLTSLPAGVTYIRGRASNSWGADLWQKGDKVTVTQGTGTIDIGALNGNSVIIFCNNVEVHNFYNNTGADIFTSYVGPAGPANKYKFAFINGTYGPGGRPISIVDAVDNNVFQLNTGGQLTVLNWLSAAANGRMRYNITGFGWTSSYQAPVNVGGAPAWTVRTVATDNNYPVTSPSVVTATYSQTENLVTFADLYLGTVYGTMNGDLLYFWSYAYNGAEMVIYRETVTVNAAGNHFSGDVRMDLQGTSRWVTGTVTGDR